MYNSTRDHLHSCISRPNPKPSLLRGTLPVSSRHGQDNITSFNSESTAVSIQLVLEDRDPFGFAKHDVVVAFLARHMRVAATQPDFQVAEKGK